ncbi:hypothetical protein E1B28_001059 [Marasmius oreades]|uniref:DUF6534 domain-containing protein n=1 Tax=Marasmius oreades TaxID=181124 RepID=A0A9P8AF06_9AGAR|nr:uncharacterized protein E1B28_001059 [Marasmius oreades]KAG7099192.1 hypothetical protein E1B28_001059 [Marasmius oreades]
MFLIYRLCFPTLAHQSPSAGPVLVGICVSSILFGVLSLQVYFYRKKFQKDKLVLQCLVAAVYIGEATQIAFALMFGWDMLVTGWGVPGALETYTWPASAHVILSALLSGTVQFFFAWRVYSLRRDSIVVRIVAVVIVLAALMQVVCGIVGPSFFIQGLSKPYLVNLKQLSDWGEAWLIGSLICDLIIATAMTWILLDYIRASTVSRTRNLIKTLILYSVETGTVTFTAALLDVIVFTVFIDNYLHLCFTFILSKLYSNALLANLNARQAAGSNDSNVISLGTMRGPTVTEYSSQNTHNGGFSAFQISTTRIVDDGTGSAQASKGDVKNGEQVHFRSEV